jgi:hypothetical protein
MAIAAYPWGNIARLFKVSTVAVLKWVKAASVQPDPPEAKEEPEVVMIDEFWHFVNEKKSYLDVASH